MLTDLRLAGTKITARPNALGELTNLEALSLSGNALGVLGGGVTSATDAGTGGAAGGRGGTTGAGHFTYGVDDDKVFRVDGRVRRAQCHWNQIWRASH